MKICVDQSTFLCISEKIEILFLHNNTKLFQRFLTLHDQRPNSYIPKSWISISSNIYFKWSPISRAYLLDAWNAEVELSRSVSRVDHLLSETFIQKTPHNLNILYCLNCVSDKLTTCYNFFFFRVYETNTGFLNNPLL